MRFLGEQEDELPCFVERERRKRDNELRKYIHGEGRKK
jgi:hypothetical protein